MGMGECIVGAKVLPVGEQPDPKEGGHSLKGRANRDVLKGL
jgi:hypothetical protein